MASEHEKTKQQRELDEHATILIDTMPRMWFALYTKMQEEGFTKQEAMEALKAFIMTPVT